MGRIMEALKCVGYIVTAILVLMLLMAGSVFLTIAGTLGGIFIFLIFAVWFIASCIKAYFESPDKRS